MHKEMINVTEYYNAVAILYMVPEEQDRRINNTLSSLPVYCVLGIGNELLSDCLKSNQFP